MKDSKLKVTVSFIGLILITVLLSLLFSTYFGRDKEKETENKVIVVADNMNVMDIAKRNDIKEESVKEALKIKSPGDELKPLKDLGISSEKAKESIVRQMNYEEEEASKNPVVIILKFVAWIILMIIAFKLLRGFHVTSQNRKIFP